MLIAGPGNDVLYGDSSGRNTLRGGAGDDTLYAGSGGDYLVAGPGADVLYGGPGNDTTEIPFAPGGVPPTDTVSGGTGSDTVLLNAGGPTPELSAAVSSTTATTITVGGAAALVAAAPGNSFAIQVDGEEMLVPPGGVSGNSVTVTRGYNGTTASTHSADAPVSLVPELAAAIPDGTTTQFSVTDAAALTTAAGAASNFVIQVGSRADAGHERDGQQPDSPARLQQHGGRHARPFAAGRALVAVVPPSLVVAPPTLVATITAGDATLTLSDVSGMAATYETPFAILIDSEQMQVTAVDVATNTLTVVRGYKARPPRRTPAAQPCRSSTTPRSPMPSPQAAPRSPSAMPTPPPWPRAIRCRLSSRREARRCWSLRSRIRRHRGHQHAHGGAWLQCHDRRRHAARREPSWRRTPWSWTLPLRR